VVWHSRCWSVTVVIRRLHQLRNCHPAPTFPDLARPLTPRCATPCLVERGGEVCSLNDMLILRMAPDDSQRSVASQSDGESGSLKQPPLNLRSVGRGVFHQVAGTIGSMSAAAMLVYMLFPLVHAASRMDFRSFNRILSVPYFPLQIVTGLIVGYAAQLKYKSRFACWVWVLPLAEFVVHFASFAPPSVLQDSWSARTSHFLGTGCRPPWCWDQMRYTASVYTAFAYSLGAYASGRGLYSRKRGIPEASI
jgi:hypothetical protein